MTSSAPNMRRIEELIHEFESADPRYQALATELLENLMEFHGTGLARLVEILNDSGKADDLIDQLGEDQLVSQLLILYDLHPTPIEDRVEQALERIRPQLHGHHGDIELIGIQDRFVRLRLKGNCNGCPSSMQTLTNLIENAIYEAAADISGLEVLGVSDQAPSVGFVPLDVFEGQSAALLKAL